MSCEFTVHCVTCGMSHPDLGNLAIGRCIWLVKHAAVLEQLYVIANCEDQHSPELTVHYDSFNIVNLSWFYTHRGHRLLPRDEYSNLYNLDGQKNRKNREYRMTNKIVSRQEATEIVYAGGMVDVTYRG